MRLLDRARQDAIAEGLVTRALKREFVRGPGGLHRLQVLIHDLVAALEVDPQGFEFALEVAGAEPQGDAPAGHVIERRHRACRDEGIAVGQHQNSRLYPQRACERGNQGQYDEGILRMVAACIQPAPGRHRMIRIAGSVEADPLGGPCNFRNSIGPQKLVRVLDLVERQRDVDVHSLRTHLLLPARLRTQPPDPEVPPSTGSMTPVM